MPKIEIKRHERECNRNRYIRVCGEVRDILYDYQVFLDGEHRATFEKHFSSGYNLYDTNRKAIDYRGRYNRITKADFISVVEQNFAKIPTVVEQEFDRAFEQARADNRKWDEDRAQYIQKLKDEVLREALGIYVNAGIDLNREEGQRRSDKRQVAKELLAEFSRV